MKKYVNGRYIEMTQEELTEMQSVPINVESKIRELKQLLSGTDYVACKLAEGVATKEEYADILSKREAWREEINTLEGKQNGGEVAT